MGILTRCLVVLLFCVSSCATGGAFTNGRRPVSVSMQVQCRTPDRDLHPALPGERLHNGDDVNLLLRADGVAHVYLLQGGSSEPPQVLVPAAGAAPPQTQPQASLRIPESGFFILHGPPGDEQLVVVVSLQPLDQTELLRRYATPQSDPPPFRPTTDGAMRCGGMRCIEDPVVRTDATGVAVLRFWYKHR